MAYKFILRQTDNVYNGLFASDMLIFKDMKIKQQYTESYVSLQEGSELYGNKTIIH